MPCPGFAGSFSINSPALCCHTIFGSQGGRKGEGSPRMIEARLSTPHELLREYQPGASRHDPYLSNQQMRRLYSGETTPRLEQFLSRSSSVRGRKRPKRLPLTIPNFWNRRFGSRVGSVLYLEYWNSSGGKFNAYAMPLCPQRIVDPMDQTSEEDG
jgi:hypothetical protein